MPIARRRTRPRHDGSPYRRAVIMNRRRFLGHTLATSAAFAARVPAAATKPSSTVWTFDNLESIGGHKVSYVGAPRLVDSPWGAAVHFDGTQDGLLLDVHPLAGATTFTIEALFRPDGGNFEQRWLHLESD